MNLQLIWFILLFVLLGGYVILDGFDLGVGILNLFIGDDSHRRVAINAIAPVWDGNEVWLLTGGGALFAAFPPVYAAVFSGFYLALMLILAALIFRAAAIEFRGKVEQYRWRWFWDGVFGVSSLVLTVLFGVAMGNVLRGVRLTADGTYAGSFFDLLNPYAMIVGMLCLITFVMHGAIYLACKTDEPVRTQYLEAAGQAWLGTILLFMVATACTFFQAPSLFTAAADNPLTSLLVVLLVVSCGYIPIGLKSERHAASFVASATVIASMMGLAAIGLFPRLLPCLNNPGASLTIYNSSSTHRTLRVMLAIALIGMPVVIAYTAVIYRVFRGKVAIHSESY
jgi:cytochrome d ubiquinol oxidase subunit II